MGLRETTHIVFSERRPIKKAGESWTEKLRRWLVECPQCAEVWLVVGARENDHHLCKGCGHGFAIKFSNAPGSAHTPITAARERH